ncbi:MAG: non-homologous end-joining DNA ligase [Actinobacteria bacterium]|nr:non-homologous end-joining DNA ligase [Actinomycetota bacterium]
MRRLRFGPAGLKDTADLEGSIAAIADAGFSACEVQFVKEFTLKEPEAARLGEIARDHGIVLSIHAPYFAQLTTKEPERLKLHFGGLHHSCKLGALMGATVVVCHPGSRGDADPDELIERVDQNLETIGPRIADTGVKLGLETCGRKSQFGFLHEIAEMVKRHAHTTPVIDYAHIHAVLGGRLKTAEAFREVFEFITEHFSDEHLSPLHCHFTDNQYGPEGEIRHVPYGSGTVRAENLIEGARGFDIAVTMISEQKESESHVKILEALRASGAPLVGEPSAAGEQPESMFPQQLPLQKRGEAHYFRKGKREVRITNVSKPLFPDDGYTKGDLATYYYNAAPLMLPFLKDRPVVMQRMPEGIDSPNRFYEKQAPKGRPDWVRTVPVPSDEGRKQIDFVIADDATTLIWLAQIASIEVHAWTSRWPDISEPDFAVMDLDPHEPITFEEVRQVAKQVKVVLDGLGLAGFPKTSGGAGLQIFIPIGPGHTYSEVREFCGSVGKLIRAAWPEKVTMEPSKPKRAGKVYIDVDQNARGQTLVAPYSVRPYPGATVSTPLVWEELEEDFMPEAFTIATLFDRVSEVGDLFRPALSLKQELKPALERLTAG